jgi:regulatory protein
VIGKTRARRPVAPLQYAVAQLARREHSRAELRAKLRRRLQNAEDPDKASAEVEKVLDSLQEKGLLSDARFAAALARSRADRFGAARIRHEMREHELPDPLVRAAVDNLRVTEEERARALFKRRFGRPASDAAERARQMRFLAQRGFSTSVVMKVVRTATADDD